MKKYVLAFFIMLASTNVLANSLSDSYPQCKDTINLIHDYMLDGTNDWAYVSGELANGHVLSVDYVLDNGHNKSIVKVLYDSTKASDGVCNVVYSISSLNRAPCALYNAYNISKGGFTSSEVQFDAMDTKLLVNSEGVEIITTPVGDKCLVVESETLYFK